MKRLITNFNLKNMIKPLVLFLFFFAFLVNVNAQTLKDNLISTPTQSAGVTSFNPAEITGNAVTITNIDCSAAVTYKWQLSNNSYFTSPITIVGETSQNFDPSMLTSTTYYRRIATFNCGTEVYSNISNTVCIAVTN